MRVSLREVSHSKVYGQRKKKEDKTDEMKRKRMIPYQKGKLNILFWKEKK